MPPRGKRPAMYNAPTIKVGGFGVLQVEAVTNRPLSIARRHLAASQLRMRDIEPDELSSSEWVRFLVMEERERDRWINQFTQKRRDSNESNASSSSTATDRETAHDKAEEARQEAEDAAREERLALQAAIEASSSALPTPPMPSTGRTPTISLWARHFDEEVGEGQYSARRPRHARRAVTEGIIENPPTYETAVRSRTPPPAYEPRSDDEGPGSPASPRTVRFNV